MRQISALGIVGVWAVLCFGGGLYGSWLGYGGRQFAATLTIFALYFAVLLLFAARGVPEFLASRLGVGSGYLLGMAVILGYLIYAFGTNTFAFSRAAAITALVFVPLVLAASAERQPPGTWQGLCHDCRSVGNREIFCFALVVALSRWALGIRVHRAALRQRCARHVLAGAAVARDRLQHCVGASLGFVHWRQLRSVRCNRHSTRHNIAFCAVCATLAGVEDASLFDSSYFVFHGLAGGVIVSRVAAKRAGAIDQERSRRLVDGLSLIWFLAHHQHGLPELAVRAPGVDCGLVLWLDLAQDRIDFRLRHRARVGRCAVALPVPHVVKERICP